MTSSLYAKLSLTKPGVVIATVDCAQLALVSNATAEGTVLTLVTGETVRFVKINSPKHNNLLISQNKISTEIQSKLLKYAIAYSYAKSEKSANSYRPQINISGTAKRLSLFGSELAMISKTTS